LLLINSIWQQHVDVINLPAVVIFIDVVEISCFIHSMLDKVVMCRRKWIHIPKWKLLFPGHQI